MNRAQRAAWDPGARVRELGPTVFMVPTITERPPRTGTVVWSGRALALVHWDGAPTPHPEFPPTDALVLVDWLIPADAPSPAPDADVAGPSPATAPATPANDNAPTLDLATDTRSNPERTSR